MKKKTIGIILVVTLIIAAVVGWCLWRQHDLAKPRAIPMPPPTSASSQTAPSDSPQPQAERQARIDMALKVEHAMRDWGVDANLPASSYAYKTAGDALAMLRAPRLTGNPIRELTALDIEDTWGPDARSVPCELGMNGDCMVSPTMGQWWANEAWAYGSRWVEEPTVQYLEDGSVSVVGDVRAVLLQDGDSYNDGDWYALTPAWRTYPVKDTLTFNDEGKVESVHHDEPDLWWIDPYLQQWSEAMPAQIGGGDRQVIPVKGQPRMSLTHLAAGRWLRGVKDMGSMDNVDWTLWDAEKMGVCLASCGGQQQGFTESPDGREH